MWSESKVLDEGLGYHYLDCGVYLRIAPKEVGCVLPSFKNGSGLFRTTVAELQNYLFPVCTSLHGSGKTTQKEETSEQDALYLDKGV